MQHWSLVTLKLCSLWNSPFLFVGSSYKLSVLIYLTTFSLDGQDQNIHLDGQLPSPSFLMDGSKNSVMLGLSGQILSYLGHRHFCIAWPRLCYTTFHVSCGAATNCPRNHLDVETKEHLAIKQFYNYWYFLL